MTRCLAVVERFLIERALHETAGHQSNASELLGLNRATLRYKLKQLGLSVDKVVSESSSGASS